MVQVYSTQNSGIPIGRVADYNNTSPARAISLYRKLNQYQPGINTTNFNQNSFANAIYGNGPFNLLRPNSTSDILAQNIDYMA